MAIWFALLIPGVGALIKLLCFRKETLWWEYLIEFGACFMLIVIFKFSIKAAQVSDTEFWGSYVTEAWYYEGWNERHHETRRVKRGNSYVTEHSSHTHEYAPYWEIHCNTGERMDVERGSTFGLGSGWAKKTFSTFDGLCRRWGEPQLVDMKRGYYTVDGDAYCVRFNGNTELIEPVTTKHSYTNMTQASSLFVFPEVSEREKSQYALHDYPPIDGYYQRQILGPGGPSQAAAERRLQIANALLGKEKQVRLYILLYQNQPEEAAARQRDLWKGGNKNEFILCIGINDVYKVQWFKTISWTTSKDLYDEIDGYMGRTFLDASSRELDLVPVVNALAGAVNRLWERRDFEQFSRLTVEPPFWAVLLTYIVTLLLDAGLFVWTIGNDFRKRDRGRDRSTIYC